MAPYNVPFSFALKFVLCTNYTETGEFFIRMKIFLLLCITYLLNIVNTPFVSPDKCGFANNLPFYADHTFYLNILAAAATVYVLCLPKVHAEVMGEIFLVLILSILATAIPMNLFLKLGSKAAKFSDLIDSSVIGNPTDDPFGCWLNYQSEDVSPALMYFAILVGFLGQNYLADWLLELTVKDTTRAELLIMQIAFCLPLAIATFIKHQTKAISIWIIDSLPLSGIIFPMFPAIMCLYYLEVPPNPIAFKVPFDKWKNLTKTLGYYFVFRWYSLITRLSIKYNLNTYDGMPALRGFFYVRLFRNFTKLGWEFYTWMDLKEMIFLTFCQDYMNALGSSAFVSRVVRYFGLMFISLSKDEKNIKVDLFALGFMPFCHIFLQFINIYYECIPCERLENLYACLVFLLIIFCSYIYTSAWQEAIGSVSFTSMKKHTEYLKVFFFLTLLPAGAAFFYSGTKSGAHEEIKKRCCYDDEPLPLDFYEDQGYDFDPIAYFAYQVSFFSALSSIAIALCMAYSWIYITDEENEEGFEGRLQTCFAAVVALEMFCSVLIFDSLSKYCCKQKSHRFLLIGMAISNVYCTIIDRGIGIAYKIYSTWKDMKGIFESMKTLGESELGDMDQKNCTICDDEIEENGRLADCTHLFHYFCIREWIGQYGPICPECNKEFKTKKRVYAPPEEEEGEAEEGAKLDPNMIEKILIEMEKFDAKSTFFTETSDTVEKKAEDAGEEAGEEEEE